MLDILNMYIHIDTTHYQQQAHHEYRTCTWLNLTGNLGNPLARWHRSNLETSFYRVNTPVHPGMPMCESHKLIKHRT